jgi:hypothetical protein
MVQTGGESWTDQQVEDIRRNLELGRMQQRLERIEHKINAIGSTAFLVGERPSGRRSPVR